LGAKLHLFHAFYEVEVYSILMQIVYKIIK